MSGTPPFEILLPEALLQDGVPDLRIASKFLALLAESGNEVQHLEVFAGMPLVNSPVPAIKQFLAVVNGARQLDAFISQVSAMLFPGRAGSKGSLCCVVAGAFTEFEITESGKNAAINWQIVRHTRPAA
ncbi:hypothetical protein NA655_13185 [Pseudomonas kuykendallii]|uniref:Uncharacterized protein n=1 Tax=Pseudomonas kuykendallii TaxID=1007099 RepID=A0A1H2ZQS6_9PSED|nr:hypothetical protein [Pseudomonas kuykendallii]MCQ4271974.1 hypothetical protein [Pseudomonas kuykendallii]SDX19204.1 hypothetical protein SAMN05216287_2393 [Pseudomonas kuykendallii]